MVLSSMNLVILLAISRSLTKAHLKVQREELRNGSKGRGQMNFITPLLDDEQHYSPNAHPSVARTFGDGEQREVVVSRGGDRCVLGPVVCQIMDQSSPSLVDNRLSRKPVGVVGGGDQLDVRPQFVEAPGIACPLVKT